MNLLFQVIKRSKTRGDVKMTLRVGPTSLDRVDGERLQHRVSSLPLLSVAKVYLFTDDATQVGTVPVPLLSNGNSYWYYQYLVHRYSRVSSRPFLSVEKVYLFTDDATQVGTAPVPLTVPVS